MKFGSEGSKKITLYGSIGEFKVLNSAYTLKYFNTVANNRDSGSGYNELLEKLSPMREKTKASEITDLRSLLQRDLNDRRVSQQLIPYLINSSGIPDHIAFFPSILCVLMPKDFIQQSEDGSEPEYPEVLKDDSKTENGINFEYDGFWEYTHYTNEDSNPIPLAMLTIYTAKTEMVVIDGQHRANAFRVISGNFNPKGSNQIYNNFYDDIKPIEEFPADLPVTILWFESSDKEIMISPEMVSRKLFLDVNNTPDRVSTSRQILMDDTQPSRVITQMFYSFLARKNSNAFVDHEFSLFHSGFDFDSDLNSKKSKPTVFTITLPEIFNYAMDWLLFGNLKYNSLSQTNANAERTSLEHFSKYIDSYSDYVEFRVDPDDNKIKSMKAGVVNEDFETLLESVFLKPIYSLYQEMNFLIPHFDACKIIGDKARELEGDFKSGVWQECWNKILKGGEGLYYVFRNNSSSNIKSYNVALDQIEEMFLTERAELFEGLSKEDVNKAYSSFLSLAFQVGYIKAFDTFYRQPDKYYEIEPAMKDFMARVNSFTAENWVYILTKLSKLYIPRVNPKVWPAYKNLIIRLIQKENEFYDSEEQFIHSPDYKIVEQIFIGKCASKADLDFQLRLNQMDYSDFDDSFVSNAILNSKKEAKEIFEKVGVELLDYGYDDHLKVYLESKCL